MLSASDIETYRICPLKYKFARVFRIPQEPTINQRFGIVLHQVLERFHHAAAAARSTHLMRAVRGVAGGAAGFGDSDDELQFRERGGRRRSSATGSTTATSEAEPVWFERSFSFRLGPHLLRGRVDRVDRLPDGTLRADRLQDRQGQDRRRSCARTCSCRVYQMGARESWGLETSAQSYFYVLDGEKVPVRALARRSSSACAATVARDRRRDPGARSSSPAVAGDLPFCDYRIICPAAEK